MCIRDRFTATNALNEATKPFILRLANNNGIKGDSELTMGLNTHKGFLTNKEVAVAHDLDYTDSDKIL